MDRPLYRSLWEELSRQKAMVFLAGPRQAGKTTLAKRIARSFPNQVYFNYDLVTNKKLLVERPTFFEDINRQDTSKPLVIYDEIHKYRRWKNYLKGIYDQFSDRYGFLILGSGRLNLFQKGGDSLAGRYFLFSLWPFTLAELANRRRSFDDFWRDPLQLTEEGPSLGDTWQQLFRVSGFPEPYLSGQQTFYRRWSVNYQQQLIREDIRNMTDIKRIDDVELLFSLLPSKIASPLSMDSLARDLQVSFNSIRSWLDVFEAFFLMFRIAPWSKKVSRAITKERKVYLFDYARVESDSARFENMVALELWRSISTWNELGLGRFGLYYVRNKEKQEVDFLIADGTTPRLLIEAKLSGSEISSSLLKFQEALRVPAIQVVASPGVYKTAGRRVVVASAPRWLAALP